MNVSIPDDSSDTYDLSEDHDSDIESLIKAISIKKVTSAAPLGPPPPLTSLPLIELVFLWTINRRDISEYSFEFDLNENFVHFDLQFRNFDRSKLPKSLSFHPNRVDLSYKWAYCAKSQEPKKKTLAWKDFADADDCFPSSIQFEAQSYRKWLLLSQAFLFVLQEDVEAEIQLIITSQHVVYLLLISSDHRLLHSSRNRL